MTRSGKKKRKRATLKADMMQIVAAWRNSGGRWPASVGEIVTFALKHDLYDATSRLRRMCARDLTEAMREEYIKDSKGRPVRRLHSARFNEVNDEGKKVQKSLWDDIDTAEIGFMEVAFQQRRTQIVGDCCQLNNDVDYWNTKHPDQQLPRTLFDFTDDVEERNQPEEYRAING